MSVRDRADPAPTTRPSWPRRPRRCRSSPTAGSPSASAPARTSNEHVVGQGWPSIDVRQDMSPRRSTVIRELHGGDLVTYDGEYFRVDSARIWDLPEQASTSHSRQRREVGREVRPLADHLIAVEPKATWSPRGTRPTGAADRRGARAIGQIPISWDPTRTPRPSARTTSSAGRIGGWAVNADLPTTAGFAGATSSSARGTSPTPSPAAPTSTRRRGGQAVLGVRFHRRRDRPDRRRDAAAVPRRAAGRCWRSCGTAELTMNPQDGP
jgi:hypothetical protein